MTDELIALEVLEFGSEVVTDARRKGEVARATGDTASAERWERKALAAERVIAENEKERERSRAVNPELSDLFGGIAGIGMEGEAFEIVDGAILRPIFAHVMSPYLLAFNRPAPGRPHPAPWKAAKGGLGFDVEVEFALSKDARPTNFDRLNTVWWLLALLRLLHPVGIRMPVVSDTSFADAAKSQREPVFWPIELGTSQMIFDDPRLTPTIPQSTLAWLRANFVRGERLMRDEGFGLAFRALDNAHTVGGRGAAMLLVWSAVEALYRPGQPGTTQKLCSSIAAHLESDPSLRDRLFQDVRRLYEVRGQITHAAETPSVEAVVESFQLARRCFILTIEQGVIPDGAALIGKWKTRT